ncbi:Uncharacterised protein [Mycobacteroides abscessus subsp. abscessus]|nr:Uncharacterised protein [Mycobacteroides abscessus subsp. abscessus]
MAAIPDPNRFPSRRYSGLNRYAATPATTINIR